MPGKHTNKKQKEEVKIKLELAQIDVKINSADPLHVVVTKKLKIIVTIIRKECLYMKQTNYGVNN